MKRYIELNENANGCTHLKIETYYNLGGQNYFTYRSEPRGYYISVSPVERVDRGGYITEAYGAFSGVKRCIKEVTRKSANAEAQAEENAKNYIHDLVRYVCGKNGLPVPAEFKEVSA